MESIKICGGEVNFLTEEPHGNLDEIRHEFDFISFCQAIMILYGLQATKMLDQFIALSMRKLLFDNNNSLLLVVCPNFKMPPLTGKLLSVPGYDNEVQLNILQTYIHIKKQAEWIPFDDWKKTRISWIDKTEKDVPKIISEEFYKKLMNATDNRLIDYYEPASVIQEKKNIAIWRLKTPGTNQKIVYNILKNSGYYDLTIGRMIKHIADKMAAHTDRKKSVWIRQVNESVDYRYSAISAFATQMIYAATKQIMGLKDYSIIEPMLETL